MYAIGIDLGGTNIATAVVNEKYEIVGSGHLPTNAGREAFEIAKDMAKTVEMAIEDAKISKADVSWIGVGTPGAVDPDNGIIENANNLSFDNVPMVKYIEELTGIKCYIANDANAAAYGEFLAGAGKGLNSFIAVTLGTGIGGGIIIDGKIFTGSNYFGAEVGHTVIVFDGEHCSCGRDGCWEAYASATALIRQTKAAMEKDKLSVMWELAPTLDDVGGRTAWDAWRKGDKSGTAVVEKYIEYVACGVVNLINTFQPDLICIGGGISKEKDNLIVPLRKIVEKDRYTKNAKKQTEIKAAELGNDAGIIGAAMLGKLYN